jgi:four helix bundle protein
MRVTCFEDLIAWQKARELRKRIYSASSKKPFSRDYKMRDQINGAALSVMSNIAEGYERNRISEFVYFLRVAKASCGEVRSQLYAAFDEGYIDENVLSPADGTDHRSLPDSPRTGAFVGIKARHSAHGTRHLTRCSSKT